jgi:hypothetical protein
MSTSLIDRSPDLKLLRDEGYDIKIREAKVLVDQVPYLNPEKKVKQGTLSSPLILAGDNVGRPDPHTVQFTGECCPCDHDGKPMLQLLPGGDATQFGTFSRKPARGHFEDYYEQITTYVALMEGPAKQIDPTATARVFPVIETTEEESVFQYLDTASSRAGITAASKKLQLNRVAIVGVGGTGSYILDLVSKTPVKQIDIYDADTLLTHNAFRAPGAPSLEELRERPKKVAYLASRYSKMHRGIKPHEDAIDENNVNDLKGADFAFVSIDPGEIKGLIVRQLVEFGIPFVDVGMGINLIEDTASLTGLLRVTTATPEKADHLGALLPVRGGNGRNDSGQNIQTAELNALNAALAVIKWKKLLGFYADVEKEFHCVFHISSNHITNGAKD